jgi:exopolysaccharide production protein ExoZ
MAEALRASALRPEDSVMSAAPAEDRPGGKLALIEIYRGLAACAVVLYHAARHLNAEGNAPHLMSVWQFGHAGVDLFFVISGFVITYVHLDDIGRPDRLGHYAARRFQRVFPLYWIATLVTLAIDVAGSIGWPSPTKALISITLFPFGDEPIVGVAWTLQFEMLFYLAFGLCILNRKAGLAAGALWLAAIFARMVSGGLDAVQGLLVSVYCLQFFAGVLAAIWVRRAPQSVPGWALPVGLVLMLAAMLAENTGLMDGYANIARLYYGLPSALIVLGGAMASRRGAWRPGRILLALGRASYSIYLFQFVFFGVVWQIWQRVALLRGLPEAAPFAALSLAAILGGVAVSRTCEYPLLRWIRHPPRRAHPAAAGDGRT